VVAKVRQAPQESEGLEDMETEELDLEETPRAAVEADTPEYSLRVSNKLMLL
jgi:hypothetical protein